MPIDLSRTNAFIRRHLGPGAEETTQMLEALDQPTLEAFIETVIPASIRTPQPLQLDGITVSINASSVG